MKLNLSMQKEMAAQAVAEFYDAENYYEQMNGFDRSLFDKLKRLAGE